MANSRGCHRVSVRCRGRRSGTDGILVRRHRRAVDESSGTGCHVALLTSVTWIIETPPLTAEQCIKIHHLTDLIGCRYSHAESECAAGRAHAWSSDVLVPGPAGALDREVLWLHNTELPDPSSYIRATEAGADQRAVARQHHRHRVRLGIAARPGRRPDLRSDGADSGRSRRSGGRLRSRRACPWSSVSIAVPFTAITEAAARIKARPVRTRSPPWSRRGNALATSISRGGGAEGVLGGAAPRPRSAAVGGGPDGPATGGHGGRCRRRCRRRRPRAAAALARRPPPLEVRPAGCRSGRRCS